MSGHVTATAPRLLGHDPDLLRGVLRHPQRIRRRDDPAPCHDLDSVRPASGRSPTSTITFYRTNGESQHFLNFFPLPHGQGSLRPTLTLRAVGPGEGGPGEGGPGEGGPGEGGAGLAAG